MPSASSIYYLSERQFAAFKKCAVADQPISMDVIRTEFSSDSALSWLRALTHDPSLPFGNWCAVDRHLTELVYQVCAQRFPLTEAGKEFFQQEYSFENLQIDKIAAAGPLVEPEPVVRCLLSQGFWWYCQNTGDEFQLLLYCAHIDFHTLVSVAVDKFARRDFFEKVVHFDWHQDRRWTCVGEQRWSIVSYALEHGLLPHVRFREHVHDSLDALDPTIVRNRVIHIALRYKLLSLTEEEMISYAKSSLMSVTENAHRLPYLLCNNTSLSYTEYYTKAWPYESLGFFSSRQVMRLHNERNNEQARANLQTQIYSNDIIGLCIALVQLGLPALVCENIVRFVLRPDRLRMVPFHYIYNIACRVQRRWTGRAALKVLNSDTRMEKQIEKVLCSKQ